ncbi:hypothetical protein QTP88_026076 [Uroleucon formosanum]
MRIHNIVPSPITLLTAAFFRPKRNRYEYTILVSTKKSLETNDFIFLINIWSGIKYVTPNNNIIPKKLDDAFNEDEEGTLYYNEGEQYNKLLKKITCFCAKQTISILLFSKRIISWKWYVLHKIDV